MEDVRSPFLPQMLPLVEPDPAAGAGEPTLALYAHPRRVAQAWPRGLGDFDQEPDLNPQDSDVAAKLTPEWCEFLRVQACAIVATDYFTVVILVKCLRGA
jgi:hypothetical protein